MRTKPGRMVTAKLEQKSAFRKQLQKAFPFFVHVWSHQIPRAGNYSNQGMKWSPGQKLSSIACHKALFLSGLNSLQFSYSYCLLKTHCGIIFMSNSWPLHPLQAAYCSQLKVRTGQSILPVHVGILLCCREVAVAGAHPEADRGCISLCTGNKSSFVPWLHNYQHSVC